MPRFIVASFNVIPAQSLANLILFLCANNTRNLEHNVKRKTSEQLKCWRRENKNERNTVTIADVHFWRFLFLSNRMEWNRKQTTIIISTLDDTTTCQQLTVNRLLVTDFFSVYFYCRRRMWIAINSCLTITLTQHLMLSQRIWLTIYSVTNLRFSKRT